jgi:lysozyme|nr:MAG TPA: Lysozyme [Caudoviricetes sp.]
MVMKISEVGIKLICKWEEFRAYAYVCPAGLWTIGYGHTDRVKPTDKIDLAQGEAYLRKDLEIVERCLNSLAIKLNQNQYDALCSLIFNIGTGNFLRSTLLKCLQAKQYDKASAEFLKWRKANGKVLKGLEARRKDEQELFDKGF